MEMGGVGGGGGVGREGGRECVGMGFVNHFGVRLGLWNGVGGGIVAVLKAGLLLFACNRSVITPPLWPTSSQLVYHNAGLDVDLTAPTTHPPTKPGKFGKFSKFTTPPQQRQTPLNNVPPLLPQIQTAPQKDNETTPKASSSSGEAIARRCPTPNRS